jgi:hypothetical protein
MANDPALTNGLQRHAVIMTIIAQLAPKKPNLVIELGRMIDELISAAIVDNLQKCDTKEKKDVLIKEIYAHYGHRWIPNEERIAGLS